MRMFRNFKFLILSLLLVSVFALSCKNEISPSNEFLSNAHSAQLSGGITSFADASQLNLDNYDIKSALGPITTTECPLDDTFFATYPEKFVSNFSLYSAPFSTVRSEDDIAFWTFSPVDIWYVFTNTSGQDVKLPKFSIPGNTFLAPAEEEALVLPQFPKIPDSGYKRGPADIDIEKSYLPNLDKSGPAKIYFKAGYLEKTATAWTDEFTCPDAHDFTVKFKDYMSFVDYTQRITSTNVLAYTSFALGGLCYGILVPLAGVILPHIPDLYKLKAFTEMNVRYKVKLKYDQWVAMYTGVNSKNEFIISLPRLYNKSANTGDYTPVNLDKQFYFFPSEFGKYSTDPEFLLLFDNNVPIRNYDVNKYWLVAEDKKPTSNSVSSNSLEASKVEHNKKYVYNYASFNYYNYYNPSDAMGVYIADGELGFGVYIPYYKWFYPLAVTDGPDGRGYYINGRLVKFEYTDYTGQIDEQEEKEVRTITFDFNSSVVKSSLNSENLLLNTQKRIDNSELDAPIRLVPKNLNNSSSLDKKADDWIVNTPDTTQTTTQDIVSNLGDKVGEKQTFIELLSSANGNYYRSATCRLVRKVDTAFGERFLVIYEDDNVSSHPSDTEYQKIADAFLVGGANNDIYDKITNIFGSEWGYLNSTYLKSLPMNSGKDIPFIAKSNTITLFYTDIGEVGESSEYLPAQYLPTDIYLNSKSSYSNERLMIHLHAPKAGGEYLEENLIALACEFEHLIHDQYFSSNLKSYIPTSIASDISGFSDYFFTFLAKVIAAGSLRDNSLYTLPSSYNLYSLSDSSYTDLFGMDKYYLFGADKLNILNLSLATPRNTIVDYNTITQSVISTLSYYIYTNFGAGFIQNYTLSGKEGLTGIISAINDTYNINLTLSDLLFSLRYATLMSSSPSQTRPHTFNYLNRFKVQGVDYPNINFYNAKSYMSEKTGVQSSTLSTIFNNSCASYRVASNFVDYYCAKAPALPNGLRLSVVLVPSK